MNFAKQGTACLLWLLCLTFNTGWADEGLAVHWKLASDTKNALGSAAQGTPHQVVHRTGGPTGGYTVFDGRESRIEIPIAPSLRLGTGDFTISVFVRTEEILDDDLGDLISHFNQETRTGFHLSLRNNSGVTHSQANYRQLQFGIDAGSTPEFIDEGRPGSAVYGQSMAVHDDQLYVGTCEAGSQQAGHVFRYEETGKWFDLGTPDQANSITGMAAYKGSLYVGSGKYRLGGSALQESENPNLGGKIFRYDGGDKWTQVAHFPEMEAIGGMVVYRGALYVGSLYKPAQFFRYEGGDRWTALEVPNGKRVEALAVQNGYLWATGYDEGHVYRFDGRQWADLGRVGEEENTQTYAFATYRGKLQVATWRTGKVFERASDQWHDRGRLGEELEVMGMLVHNGSFYAGTLPTAQIYRYEGGQKWTMLKQLDTTPDVKYRRLWTMAQYRGKLFSTTLPSAHVWSMQAGSCVTWDREFPSGWHHIAAQRQGDILRLFVDGNQVAESAFGKASQLNVDHDGPWQIGAGSGDFFNGGLADMRIYKKALSADEIRNLLKSK